MRENQYTYAASASASAIESSTPPIGGIAGIEARGLEPVASVERPAVEAKGAE